jgi:hypothetical protein
MVDLVSVQWQTLTAVGTMEIGEVSMGPLGCQVMMQFSCCIPRLVLLWFCVIVTTRLSFHVLCIHVPLHFRSLSLPSPCLAGLGPWPRPSWVELLSIGFFIDINISESIRNEKAVRSSALRQGR